MYAYVGASPTNFVDLFGLDKKPSSGGGSGGNGADGNPPGGCGPGGSGPSGSLPRLAMAGRGLLNLGIGAAKLSAGVAAAVESGGLLAPLGYYSAVSGIAGNGTAGIFQLIGAATGNLDLGNQGAEVAGAATSISGLVTLVATHGDLEAAGTAAGIEGIGLTSFQAGFGAGSGDSPKWFDYADGTQNANDLMGQGHGVCP